MGNLIAGQLCFTKIDEVEPQRSAFHLLRPSLELVQLLVDVVQV